MPERRHRGGIAREPRDTGPRPFNVSPARPWLVSQCYHLAGLAWRSSHGTLGLQHVQTAVTKLPATLFELDLE
jgi:hypothetical protein